MKSFAALLPALGLIAGAQAWANETIWTTRTVQTLTTYCPEATTITHGTKTYTATAHETLTITDCPCTIKHPVKATHTPVAPPASSHKPTTIGSKPPISVTITVSEYTTYCPYPTLIPVGPNSTLTVTQETTLTISQCPCTLTKPAVVTTTVSYITTFCPEPTTLTIGTSTHTLPAGTVTIPVEHQTTIPAPETTKTAPETIQTITLSCTKPGCEAPSVTTSLPISEAPPASTKPVESEVTPPVSTKPGSPDCTTPGCPQSPPASTEPVESQISTPYSTQPATTAPPTQPAASGVLLGSSTSTLLEANNAVKRDAGFGAVLIAGLAAALL